MVVNQSLLKDRQYKFSNPKIWQLEQIFVFLNSFCFDKKLAVRYSELYCVWQLYILKFHRQVNAKDTARARNYYDCKDIKLIINCVFFEFPVFELWPAACVVTMFTTLFVHKTPNHITVTDLIVNLFSFIASTISEFSDDNGYDMVGEIIENRWPGYFQLPSAEECVFNSVILLLHFVYNPILANVKKIRKIKVCKFCN